MKTLTKIDKFYYYFFGVMFVMSLFMIFTIRAIFSAIAITENLDTNLLQANTPRINESNIQKALDTINSKDTVDLDLGV